MNTQTPSFVGKIRAYIIAHKIVSAIIACVVIFAGYKIIYSKGSTTATKYIVTDAQLGTVIETVTGSGQVSAAEQIPVQSTVSGTLISLPVTNGEEVKAGQLLAEIDPTQASLSLQNAQLSLAQLTEAPDALALAQDQDSVEQAYNSGWGATSNLFINLPNILEGLNTLINTPSGYLSEGNTRYINANAFALRNTAASSYGLAETQFQTALADYNTVTRQSATSTLDSIINEAYTTAQVATTAVQDAKNALDYIQSIAPAQTAQQTSQLDTAETNIDTWTTEIDSNLSSLLSGLTSIQESNDALTKLVGGPDPLAIQAQELSLEQAQNSYDNYFIKAPVGGMFALSDSIELNDTVSGTIGTVISDQKIATISLNEVDAAKIQIGQPVTLTFDAIDGLSIAGKVSNIDLIGTVSQGVVTYNVTIAFETNDVRVKSGMSVDASIDTQVAENVLTVPASAVSTQGTNSYVQMFATPLTPNAAGVISLIPPKRIPVQVGISNDTLIQIVSGLKVGDQIVSRTIASTAATTATAAAPSLFSAAGAGARGGGGFGGGARGGAL